MRTRLCPAIAAVLLTTALLLGACAEGKAPLAVLVAPTLPAKTLTAPFDLPIVMYHDVVDAPLDDIYRAEANVSPASFAGELRYLQCAGYTTITPSHLIDAIEGHAGLPAKPIVLTFDDGYANHYTQAFPILKQYGMTGAFAIITGFVEGGGDYMSWAQIKEMSDAGMEIMSHTVTHIDLNSADDSTAAGQMRDSRTTIEQHTGKAPAGFVYPAGEPFRSGTAERQGQVVSMLAQSGYRVALLAGPASATQDPARPFALNRLRMGGGTSLAQFAALVGGPPPKECGG